MLVIQHKLLKPVNYLRCLNFFNNYFNNLTNRSFSLYYNESSLKSCLKDDIRLNRFILGNNSLDDESYIEFITKNAQNRKDKPNIEKLRSLWNQLKKTENIENKDLSRCFQKELFSLSNITCPNSVDLTEPKVITEFGQKLTNKDALVLEKLSHHGVEMGFGHFTGSRSYYLRGSMARLEHNLIRYVVFYG